MTIERKFKCDFCCDIDSTTGTIHGMYWLTDDKIELRQATVCDFHLCDKCFRAIAAASEPVAKEPSEPAPVGDDLLTACKALVAHDDAAGVGPLDDDAIASYTDAVSLARAGIANVEEARRAAADPEPEAVTEPIVLTDPESPPPSPDLLAAAEALCELPCTSFGKEGPAISRLRDVVAAEKERLAEGDVSDSRDEFCADIIAELGQCTALDPCDGWESDPAHVVDLVREIVAVVNERAEQPESGFERLADAFQLAKEIAWRGNTRSRVNWKGSKGYCDVMAFIDACRGGSDTVATEKEPQPENFRAALETIADLGIAQMSPVAVAEDWYRAKFRLCVAEAQRAIDAGPEPPVVDADLVAMVEELAEGVRFFNRGSWQCPDCGARGVDTGDSIHKDECIVTRARALVARVRSRADG